MKLAWLPLLLALGACTATRPSELPAHARREAPPQGLERALPVGAVAPDVDLQSAQGDRFRLAEQLAKGPGVLVFYRGRW